MGDTSVKCVFVPPLHTKKPEKPLLLAARACAHQKSACDAVGALIPVSASHQSTRFVCTDLRCCGLVLHIKSSGTNWRVSSTLIRVRNCTEVIFFTLFSPPTAAFKGIKGDMLLFFGCLPIRLQPYHLFRHCSNCLVQARRIQDKASSSFAFLFSFSALNLKCTDSFTSIFSHCSELLLRYFSLRYQNIFPLRFLNILQVLVRHLQVQMSH